MAESIHITCPECGGLAGECRPDDASSVTAQLRTSFRQHAVDLAMGTFPTQQAAREAVLAIHQQVDRARCKRGPSQWSTGHPSKRRQGGE